MTSTIDLYTFNGVPDVLARTVTTTITGATFSDGAVLSGSWTANYDSAGNLLDQVSGQFTVTGPAGTATFTVAGTLPYANQASNTSYEIHFMSSSGTGYAGLYVDWKGETPSTLALGTPSLYTSVLGTDSLLPLRLVSGGTITQSATCFLSGTRLLTPSGEVAVEHLRAGDIVSVARDGVLSAETIRWVGSRTVDQSSGIVPVRIRADAFGDGLPHADLLVTPEHCILVDGGLVPARMLVNGGSIVADDAVSCFTFHHVELERHGILLAENLPTESYLDTGNRANFATNPVVALTPALGVHAGALCWQTDACAPLCTDRETAEPIWNRLRNRSMALGFGVDAAEPVLSGDPMLRVLLDNGVELDGCVQQHGETLFRIPEAAIPLALLSRSARPSEMIGPFVDDRRRLGVKVGALLYGDTLAPTAIAMDRMQCDGWHDPEADGRWTDGAAGLALAAAGVETTLIVRVVGTMRYAIEPVAEAALQPTAEARAA